MQSRKLNARMPQVRLVEAICRALRRSAAIGECLEVHAVILFPLSWVVTIDPAPLLVWKAVAGSWKNFRHPRFMGCEVRGAVRGQGRFCADYWKPVIKKARAGAKVIEYPSSALGAGGRLKSSRLSGHACCARQRRSKHQAGA
jgi:hypothetical protein